MASASTTDFTFAFNVREFSGWILRIEVVDDLGQEDMGEYEDYSTCNTKHPAALKVENIHINAAILAANSRFFYELFPNVIEETGKRHVPITIKASEEDAFMDLLHFMYSNTLRSSDERALIYVLMIADKFEAASCMEYCIDKLSDFEMSLDSALLYLDLHANMRMPDAVQPLFEAAKQFIASGYKDITGCFKEIIGLPLAGFEVVLVNDDLHVPSEDEVFNLVLKYVRTHYPSMEERRNVVDTRLSRLIRFPYMSCPKLKNVLTCPEFELESTSKVVIEALLFMDETPQQKRNLAAADTLNRRFTERTYMCPRVKVMEFELSQHWCDVYLDLKREECADLFPSGRVHSQTFYFKRRAFLLCVQCNMDEQNAFPCLGIYLTMCGTGSEICSVNLKFSVRTKPRENFEDRHTGLYYLTRWQSAGHQNLLSLPWTEFMATDSKYFVRDILHLKAELKMRPL